ncbi:unnamed protein product, partial [Didymodactylos carnosus]
MLNSSSTATTTLSSDKKDNNNNTDNNTITMDDQSRAPANVWLYATRAADGKSATCNICAANIKTNRYSTTTLRSHLVSQHGKTELKLPSREIKEECDCRLPPQEKKKLHDLCIRCIVQDGRAFGDLSKPGIPRLIHAIVPVFIGTHYDPAKKWSDRARNFTKDTSDPISASNIVQAIKTILKDLGIYTKVITITCDGASNMVKACEGFPSIQQIWCVAHRLHLVICNALGFWIKSKSPSSFLGGITPTESASNDTDSNNDEDDDENDDENDDEDPYMDVENGNSILTDITMLIENNDNPNEDENIEDEPQQEEEQDAELLHDAQSDIEDNDDYEITDNWEKNLIHDFSYQQSEEVDQKHIICVLK